MAIDINVPSQVRTFANLAAFPASGTLKTIFIAEDTNKTYRWTGSVYVEVSAGGAGGVTAVTASAPIVSTGGTTPDIQISQSSSIDDGYLSATDWITFNEKQNELVSGTNIKTINGSSILGSGNLVVGGGGGGLQGVHALQRLASGQSTCVATTSGSLVNSSITANRVLAVPFIPNQNITTSALYISVTSTAGSGFARILIYSDLNGLPNTKLYESANLDCSTNGIKTASTTFNFVAGTTYWLCAQSNLNFNLSHINTAALFPLAILGIANPNTHVFISAPFGSAPTTFGTPTITNGAFPFIGITQA